MASRGAGSWCPELKTHPPPPAPCTNHIHGGDRGSICAARAPCATFQTCLPARGWQRHTSQNLTHFWSPNNPFSWHFVSFDWPKCLAMRTKRARFICLCTANGLGSYLEKHIFEPFFDPFLVAKQPIFHGILRLCSGQNGLQWAQKGLISLV